LTRLELNGCTQETVIYRQGGEFQQEEHVLLLVAGQTGIPVRNPRASVKALQCRAALGGLKGLGRKGGVVNV